MFAPTLITFAGDAFYGWYVEAPQTSSLSPLEDQRLGGGVMMWVPGTLVLWTAITIVYFRWTHREVRKDETGSTARPLPTPAGMVTFAPPARSGGRGWSELFATTREHFRLNAGGVLLRRPSER